MTLFRRFRAFGAAEVTRAPFRRRGPIGVRPVQRRVDVATALFALWAIGIEAKLIHLQVFQRAKLEARARDQQQESARFRPSAARSSIATDTSSPRAPNADSIYCRAVGDQDPAEAVAKLCAALRDCTTADRQTLLSGSATRSIRLGAASGASRRRGQARHGPAAQVHLAASPRAGATTRTASSLLTCWAGSAREQRARAASSTPTTSRSRLDGQVVITNRRQRQVFSRLEEPSMPGAQLELTIDEHLQHVAERELRAAVRENRAIGGSAIVHESTDGRDPRACQRTDVRSERAPRNPAEIQAAGIAPSRMSTSQDPRSRSSPRCRGHRRTRRADRLDDRHEPRVHPDRLASSATPRTTACSRSPTSLPTRAMSAPSRSARESASSACSRYVSALRVRPEDLRRISSAARAPGSYLRRRLDRSHAGLGVDRLPVGVTPLQMLAAVGCDRQRRRSSSRVWSARSIGTASGSRCSRRWCEQVVSPKPRRPSRRSWKASSSTAPARPRRSRASPSRARPGRRRRWSMAATRRHYNASFVGFVPSRDPKLAIIVVIDSPRAKGYYGGVVSAPVFRGSPRRPPASGSRTDDQREPPLLVAAAGRSARTVAGADETPAVSFVASVPPEPFPTCVA